MSARRFQRPSNGHGSASTRTATPATDGTLASRPLSPTRRPARMSRLAARSVSDGPIGWVPPPPDPLPEPLPALAVPHGSGVAPPGA